MIKRLGFIGLIPLLTACPEEGGTLTPPPPAAKQAVAPAKGKAASMPNPHGEVKDKKPDGGPISGLVKLGEGLTQADIKPTDVLFLMARESLGGGKFGRLLAVQRHGKVEFPKRYELSKSDVMVPGIPFAGPFIVMARIDRDGDPMTKKPEDLYAVYKGEVQSGQEGVHLILSAAKATSGPPPAPPAAASQPGKTGAAPVKKAAPPPLKAASQPVKKMAPVKAVSQPVKAASQAK